MRVQFRRDTDPDGTVTIRSERCAFSYRRPRPGLVLITIIGAQLDDGAMGSAPMEELESDLEEFAPVELFIDGSEAAGAVVTVQEQWAEWFARHRSAITSVSMLVRGNYMHFTVELMKFFSRTGELIRVYLDRERFGDALTRATGRT